MSLGLISVVVPCYNRAGLVEATLRSLLNQTEPADEIIVVDDGSIDGTEAAARAAYRRWESEKVNGRWWEGRKSPEFKVIRQANAGPGAARNRGFAESRGEYIHFFDSDDIAAPNKHEVQVRALQETDADIAYGPWVKGHVVAAETLKGGNAEKLKPPNSLFLPVGHVLQQKCLPKGDQIKDLLTRWSIVPQACMFRRSVLEKSGGFPPQMFAAEDQLLILRCFLQGAKVVHSPETLTFYRLGHEGKLTESSDGHLRRTCDWARYLVIAAKECRARGIEPALWFRFRLRCWQARRELVALGVEPDLAAALAEISGGADGLYAASSTLLRWRGGFMVRLTGSREDASFRPGPMTSEQLALFPGG